MRRETPENRVKVSDMDGDRDSILPSFWSRSELKSISPETLKKVMNGEMSYRAGGYTLIDCRYPYEYKGGHLQGAINIADPAELVRFSLDNRENGHSTIFIFYCEHSTDRAPKMMRLFLEADAQRNFPRYPNRDYPHVFLLGDGYKPFYKQNPELCEPQGYIKMFDVKYTAEYSTYTRMFWRGR